MDCQSCKRNELFVAAMGGSTLVASMTDSIVATFVGMVAFSLLIWALRKNASRKADRAAERTRCESNVAVRHLR